MMLHRVPKLAVRALRRPALPRNSTSAPQSCTQSTSATPSSRPRPSIALESFARQTDLLTARVASSPLKLETSDSAAGPSSVTSRSRNPPDTAWAEPILKGNPYAATYAVSEEDLAEDTDVRKEGSGSQGVLRKLANVRKLAANGRADRAHRLRRGGLWDDDVAHRSEPQTFKLSPAETVECHSNHLIYHTSPNRSTPITLTRLRDACPCAECIHPSTRQKTRTSGDALSHSPQADFTFLADKVTGKRGLRANWARSHGQARHTSFYPFELIRELGRPITHAARYLTQALGRTYWMGEDLASCETLRYRYEDIIDGDTPQREQLLAVLEQLQVYGIAIIQGVPTNPTSDKTCMLRKVAGWIGEIRNTFYGETWDVKSLNDSKNVAYTSLNLGLHMDLLYFSSPPRFQALHCLRNRVVGGSSYFVDGFQAVRTLQQRHSQALSILQRFGIDFQYDNDGHYLRCRHSLASEDLRDLHAAVNWSPPFQAPPRALTAWASSPDEIGGSIQLETKYYEALAEFERLLDRPSAQYEFLMEEGDLVLFDNRRVLHARRKFRDLTPEEKAEKGVEVVEGEPTRWLKGLYLDGEVVWDKLVGLHRQEREKNASL